MIFSWVDGLFLVVLLYFLHRGWKRGFLYLSTGVIAVIVSLFIAMRYADAFSRILDVVIKLPSTWSLFISFFTLAFLVESVLSMLLSQLLIRTPQGMKESLINRIIGACFSAGSGVVFLAGFFFFILLVPVRGDLKTDIRSSLIAPVILSFIDRYGGPLPRVLNDSARVLTQFLTISPESKEKVTLNVHVDQKKLRIDDESEAKMLELLNTERRQIGVAPLSSSLSMQDVARQYSKKMLIERFFAHIDPQGQDVASRLQEGGVRYLVAGENLAYAPDVDIAHDGLMNSEGHRRNMLDPEFTRVGIGVIDAGIWGKMFTQVFAN